MKEEKQHEILHDLKSPLISIEGFANLLLESEGKITAAERKNHLERILANVNKMNALLEELRKLF